jgi:predicted O-linked N-acetylglucosamine transferase (SPINDLY family)
LARDRGRLAGLTERLKANRMTTPLFDTDSFARYLEEAYVQMYQRYQDGLAPEYIRVGG